MVQWADFPWNEKLYANADETILRRAVAAVENAFANDAGGHSRFPGLKAFATTGGNRNVLKEYGGGLFAAADNGRLYSITKSGAVTDVTGAPLVGTGRPVFAALDDQLVVAAGGPILSLRTGRTARLAASAPATTHVAFVDGYTIAIEARTQRFRYSDPGEPTVWNDLSVFSADGKGDPLNAAIVTPYRELLLCGHESIEQYERLPNGSQPFARRWTTGDGVAYPHTIVADRSGTYGVNTRAEFVRFFGQVAQAQSDNVGLLLSKIDDWTGAWANEVTIQGDKFIILQMPAATNAYETKGVTFLYDYRGRRWSQLFGWDDNIQMPTRWPGWSVAYAWGKVFVGVPGGIAELDPDTYDAVGQRQRFLIRSGHVDKFGPSRIDNVRVRIKRGVGALAPADRPLIALRPNRDQEGFDQWQYEDLGRPGERNMVIEFGPQGMASTWQFEIAVSDPVSVEFVAMQVHVERLRW